MKKIIDVNGLVSAPFTIPCGGQTTFLATGLVGDDEVTFHLVKMTDAGPPAGEGGSGPVALSDLQWETVLKVEGKAVVLTEDNPYVVLDVPQVYTLIARKNADDLSVVELYAASTWSQKPNYIPVPDQP